MMTRMLSSTALIALVAATPLRAEMSPDAIVQSYQSEGYSRVEVKTGLTQTKVEAIKGSRKVEVIYDTATGGIIKQEWENVSAGDDTMPGVEIKTENKDFTSGGGSSDDDDDDKSDSSSDDDDDDDDDHKSGGSHDDDDDDDDKSGSSDDDDDDDDDKSGSSHDDDDDDDDGDDDDDDDDDHGGHSGKGGGKDDDDDKDDD